jgi:hypothetical protein
VFRWRSVLSIRLKWRRVNERTGSSASSVPSRTQTRQHDRRRKGPRDSWSELRFSTRALLRREIRLTRNGSAQWTPLWRYVPNLCAEILPDIITNGALGVWRARHAFPLRRRLQHVCKAIFVICKTIPPLKLLHLVYVTRSLKTNPLESLQFFDVTRSSKMLIS